MKKQTNSKVIDFSDDINILSMDYKKADDQCHVSEKNIEETENDIEELKKILSEMGIPIERSVETDDSDAEVDDGIGDINNVLSEIVEPGKLGGSLDLTDVLVAIVAGVIASLIDIIFVGAPEVVKIYRRGEDFNGSMLTEALRKIGNTDNSKIAPILDKLCKICSVPYDISCEKGVVTPDNHRLRNFAHDPLFGLLFAVADIIMGTTTCIDNNGMIQILKSSKEVPIAEKLLAPLYYLGHLVSDVCTARGLPIPGFFVTQFFTEGGDKSLAKIAEGMYKDGYDFRHLLSMQVPVAVKNLIISVYEKYRYTPDEMMFEESISEREIKENWKKIRTYEMHLISDIVADGVNLLKFAMPMTNKNMTALNLCEWLVTIKDGLIVIKAATRDKSVEQLFTNRNRINQTWEELKSI